MSAAENFPSYEYHRNPADEFDTYRRRYYDTATWLAEALDGSMLTCFEYTSDGSDLFAEDGSRMSNIFLDSYNDALRIVAEKPAFAFELRRRKLELEEFKLMVQMVRGQLPNTMIVVSDFPPELMNARSDVGGYNITRKQTMLRILAWDGQRMRMFSQSLDGSDRSALESVYAAFGEAPRPGELLGQRIHRHLDKGHQDYLTGELTGVYDRSMAARFGGVWHAGRREEPRNTYDFVLSQHDLLDYFATRFLHREPTDQDRYNLAALANQRFNGGATANATGFAAEQYVALTGLSAQNIDMQMRQAGDTARAAGMTFSGCGLSVEAARSGDGLTPSEQLAAAGYGNRVELHDKLGSRTFYCPNGHENFRRVANRPEPVCRTCRASVACGPPKKPARRPPQQTAPRPILFRTPESPEVRKHAAAKAGRAALALIA